MTYDAIRGAVRRTAAVLATSLIMGMGSALAQTAPAQAPVEVPAGSGAAQTATTGAEHDWHPFSSNAARIYMADVRNIVVEDGVSRVSVAKPPLHGAPGDYSHAVEVVEFRCATKESRSTTEIQYGPDGAETERYDDPTAWESYRPDTRDGYLANLVCGDERSSNNVPSIKTWVDAGRKGG